ncbi:MAG: archaellin/type IV pilin N-terminal domain-containing protein [Candidatus Bathyarchaeia archaeon]
MIVKFRRAKKGIAEIVAVLLLILITVAGATILYVYSSGLLGSLQGAQPQKPYSQMISVEYYDWSSTTAAGVATNSQCYDKTLHTLCLNLRNVGSGVAVLSEFFVAGVKITQPITGTCAAYTISQTTFAYSTVTGIPTYTTASGLLPLGPSSCTAILTIPNTGVTQTIISGVAYSVKVVTADGSVFSYSLVAGLSTGTY